MERLIAAKKTGKEANQTMPENFLKRFGILSSALFGDNHPWLMVHCVVVNMNSEHHLSTDLQGSCSNLYMRVPMVEHVSQTIERDMVNCLKQQRNLMVKLKSVVVFRNHLGLYSNLVCSVRKGLDVLPKGLGYALLTTELAAKTCHDTG